MTSKKKVAHTIDCGIAVVIDEKGNIHISASKADLSTLCGQVVEEEGKSGKKKKYCDKCSAIAFPKKKK